MSGHLLSSVNPEAAAAITAPSPAAELPSVGDSVRFFPRFGEARGGRTEFFMLVTEVRPDLLVNGICIVDANDFKELQGLRRRSPDNMVHCWDFRSEPRIERLEAQVAELKAQLTGGVALALQSPAAASTESDAELIADVNARLEDVERRLSGVEVRPQTGPAKRGRPAKQV